MSLEITFLRHGRADKTLPNHRLHPLSEEGVRQAESRRTALGNPKFDLILHSSLRRTRETALVVAGLGKDATTVEIPSLFYEDSDSRGRAIDQAFEKLGHAPLAEYKKMVGEQLASFASDAKTEIWIKLVLQMNPIIPRIRKVLIVGHAVLTQAVCEAFTRESEPFANDILGECEGFEISVERLPGKFIRSLK